MGILRQRQITIIGLLLVTFVLLSVIFVVKLPAEYFDLDATSWILISWGEPTAPSTPLNNTRITAKFTSNTISGSASCNQYIANYQTQESKLIINIAAISRKLCPEDIMNQERRYLAALEGAQSYNINDKGQLQISYMIEKTSGLLVFN